MEIVLDKVHQALNSNGIFYISLKYADDYTEILKKDEFGRRMFYLYNPSIIETLFGGKFRTLKIWQKEIGRTRWFEMALQKI